MLFPFDGESEAVPVEGKGIIRLPVIGTVDLFQRHQGSPVSPLELAQLHRSVVMAQHQIVLCLLLDLESAARPGEAE